MREIGSIKLLQIQRSSLKLGECLHTYYDPAPLLVVQCLLLSSGGVIGLTEDQQEIMDLHHSDHPLTHNNGKNGVSVGFTTHYQAMREQYGAHLSDGIAGENILVATERAFALADLGRQVVIENQQTSQRAYLSVVKAASPCVEFTHFAVNRGLSLSAAELKAALQFLDGGRRGFYMRAAERDVPVAIQVGDRVFIDDGE